jgi:hypothetical protein
MENELQISRIPETVNGIQVNFCKNPQCPNFGVPASNEKQPRGPGASERGLDLYIVQGGGRSDSSPRIECRKCKEKPPLKSNSGINSAIATKTRGRIGAVCSAHNWTIWVDRTFIVHEKRAEKVALPISIG